MSVSLPLRWMLGLGALAILSGLLGCGGEQQQVAPSAAPDRLEALNVLRVRALSGADTTADAASAADQLMDFAESSYPQWFPGSKPSLAVAPFRYRHYPETGIYLGVVVEVGGPYEWMGVYVMGGNFGNEPLFAGPLRQFIRPGVPRNEWLAGYAGRMVGAEAAQPAQLLAVKASDPSQQVVVESSGTFLPMARIFAADIDPAGNGAMRLRERWHLYLRNGRLMRLDLEPGAASLPASTPVSTLNTLLGVCRDDRIAVFQNLPQPDRAWLVFSVPAQGTECLPNVARAWLAVRTGMAPGESPLRLTARPVDALRDAKGAITGFIVQQGVKLDLTGPSFETERNLIDGSSSGITSIVPIGVRGRHDAQHLLYLQTPNAGIKAMPLQSGQTSFVMFPSGTGHPFLIAEDESGMYMLVGQRLLRIDRNFQVTRLNEEVPATDRRLYLTPTKVVMVMIDPSSLRTLALIAVPKSGGAVEVVFALGDRYLPQVAVVGEDIFVEKDTGTSRQGLHLVASDGSAYVDMPQGFLAASLWPQTWDPSLRKNSFDHSTGTTVFGSDASAGVLVVTAGSLRSYAGAPLVRFGPGRRQTVLGSFPSPLVNAQPVGTHDVFDTQLGKPSTDPWGPRLVSAYQAGGYGLLRREQGDLYLVDTEIGLHRLTRVEAF